MRNLIYYAFVIIMFVSCGPTHEQKADKLIKDSLKKTLYKPETYKPVETKVDSAFAPYDNPKLFEEIVAFCKMNMEYMELDEKVSDAKSSMLIWNSPYMSEFEKNEYQEAKSDYDEANLKIEKLKNKMIDQYKKIISMLQSERKFIGYKATHNYRADNNAGNTLIGNSMFFFDKNLEEITFNLEVDEYNQIQESIKQLQEQLAETK